jgi:hypothetical protein
MSHLLVLGVFETLAHAAHAARAAHALGVTAERLSVVARNHQEEGELARRLDGTPGVEIEDSRRAAILGELGAYLLAAVAVGVPGLGAVFTAGPLSAEFGEAAGHAGGGGLAAVLGRSGVEPATAHDWETRVRAGAILLAVHSVAGTADAVLAAFDEAGATASSLAHWP